MLITSWPPLLYTCLSSSGSRSESSVSPTFSSRTGVPNCIAFSSCRAKSLWLSLMTHSVESFSMFRIHLLAWPWGSMSSGQRRECDMMMALSTETASRGRPEMFHSRILTCSPRTDDRKNSDEQGMFRSRSEPSHSLIASSRNWPVNTPRYATTALPINTSPLTLLYATPRSFTCSLHRTRSPPRPEMSFSARPSFFSHWSTWCARLVFSSLAPVNRASRSATRSCTSRRAACFSSSSCISRASDSSASASIRFFGSTTLATLS
mmetsp:Transcript_10877/g.24708  ORF Transcript_10877/g.24708 Transcript_10877/m.24708 type:complete len:264 (-) Transcript_10877:1834-2625(-)